MTTIPMDQDSIFQDSSTVNQLNELRELAKSSPQLA